MELEIARALQLLLRGSLDIPPVMEQCDLAAALMEQAGAVAESDLVGC